jgi:hypothetical protein
MNQNKAHLSDSRSVKLRVSSTEHERSMGYYVLWHASTQHDAVRAARPFFRVTYAPIRSLANCYKHEITTSQTLHFEISFLPRVVAG